jgi:Cu-Zn family superoxide dismutase
MAVAVFSGENGVEGTVLFETHPKGCKVVAEFKRLPPGNHGFHIHKGGDLRGEGCQGACDHFHKGKPQKHGGPPTSHEERHTGDLGNISGPSYKVSYILNNVTVTELFGRSVIVHADSDDFGKGGHEDSHTTGHSGKRIGCAIIGRIINSCSKGKTRKIVSDVLLK